MTTQYFSTPPEESELIRVLRELTGEAQGKERCALDLVIVLDITNINGVLKRATEYVIKTLSPIDRVSIVTFSDDANMMCDLREINEESKQYIINLVDGIVPGDGANISDGLEMALQVLSGRIYPEGRSVGIILMSNNEQNSSAQVDDVGSVPVYSFSFGASGKESLTTTHVLEAIPGNSDGETFPDVHNTTDSSFSFSECFAGIWTVALRVLKLSRYGTTSRKKPPLSREEYDAMSCEDTLLADDDSERWPYERSGLSRKKIAAAICELTPFDDDDTEILLCGYEEEALSSPLTLSSQLAYERPGFTTRDDTKKQP